jgi:hypothetical protein
MRGIRVQFHTADNLMSSARSRQLPWAVGGGLLAQAIIDIPCRCRHCCRERSLSTTIETRGGEKGGELPSCYRRCQLTREPATLGWST